MGVIFFDLDETLIDDKVATAAAFNATALLAFKEYSVNVEKLALSARVHADRLLINTSMNEYCVSIGISASEAMWCDFEGEGSEIKELRDWAPKFQKSVWELAMADQGVVDNVLSKKLAKFFFAERRSQQFVYKDVVPLLDVLKERFEFGLITNGASSLQRQKLKDSGLEKRFKSITVSSELGFGKPDSNIFNHALSMHGVNAKECFMVGDNLMRDIAGAMSVGMNAVWINRYRHVNDDKNNEYIEVSSLVELMTLMIEMSY